MIFAFIAMALAAVSGLAGFAGEEIEEELQRLEEDLQEELEQLDLRALIDDLEDEFDPPDAGPGFDETLQGTEASDTLSGDAGDADVLQGFAGDDLLTLADANTGTGGEGSDTFEIAPGADAVITDFQPGVDVLRINADELLRTPDVPYALDWRMTDEGAELHYATRGSVNDAPDSRIVTLTGLSEAPDPTDVELVITDAGQNEVFVISGTDLNFIQRLEGTSGADEVVLDDAYSEYELSTGDGDDRVFFDSFRGQTDLGAGDDTYRSNAEYLFGNPFRDPSETVIGGAGDDIIEGGTAGFIAEGGTGDDTISALRTDSVDILYAQLRGGDGADSLIFGDHALAVGGAGADTFTVSPILESRPTVSQIDDFDPDEDAVIIQLDPGYAGPGSLTLTVASFGYGSAVQVDGVTAVQFSDRLTDLSGIVVMQ